MELQRLSHPRLTRLGEGGECPSAVLRAALATDEPCFGQSVDRPRQSARREPRLGCEIAHAKPAARATGKADQDVEFLACELALALKQRRHGPVQTCGGLEDQSYEGYPVARIFAAC